MQQTAERLRQAGKRIVFVPTMGFLHDGHLSLMRIGRPTADVLVVSIFVNPAQFAPHEDFDTYPRDLERDLRLCRSEMVDIVFTPQKASLYGDGYQTYVKLDHLPGHLCGLSRPIFFTGVATIVAKLFNIVKPHAAVFGQKDYQQLRVIERMVKDLNFDIDVIGAPIVRESDGLAMSSRNAYLTDAQRPAALSLYRSLNRAREMVRNGIRESARILAEAEERITRHSETKIDYAAICDPQTLETVDRIDDTVLMALAVHVARTRLIDNMLLTPETGANR